MYLLLFLYTELFFLVECKLLRHVLWVSFAHRPPSWRVVKCGLDFLSIATLGHQQGVDVGRWWIVKGRTWVDFDFCFIEQ